jgi:hypothetical protein
MTAYRREQLELARDYHRAFPLIHTFARAKWSQIEGGKWRSEKGRVLSNESYQRLQTKLKAPATKAGPKTPKTPKALTASKPAAQAPKAPQPPAAQPTRAPATFTTPELAPSLHPKEAEHLEAKKADDTARYGPQKADWLHRAAHAVRAALAGTVGGLTAANGAAYGALAGGAIGGLPGLALGTAIGGGLGVRAGMWGAKRIDQASRGKGRLTVMMRKGARKVDPTAGMIAGATPGAVLATGTGLGYLHSPLYPFLGLAGLGLANYFPTKVAVRGGKLGYEAATAALHPSVASRRVARQYPETAEVRRQERIDARNHSERPKRLTRFTDLSSPNRPNPNALISARLKLGAAKAGIKLPPIPPELVQQCLTDTQRGGALQQSSEATPIQNARQMSEMFRELGQMCHAFSMANDSSTIFTTPMATAKAKRFKGKAKPAGSPTRKIGKIQPVAVPI